jgi:hypothetical protein
LYVSTAPSLTPILVNSVGSNPMNNEVLTIIGSSVAWVGGFAGSGHQLQ